MNSRERVNLALNLQEADRAPLDLGGGVDTLPMGSPEEVRAQVRERINIFGSGGGFVFNTTHNVQPKTPLKNVLAMYETVREYGHYPLS